MRLLRRLALAVSITVLSAGILTTTATAAQAVPAVPDGSTGSTGSDVGVLDTCVYWVMYNGVPVHENPDTDSVVRKWKNYGERVEGPCLISLDVESGLYFVAVFCGCATDHEGWISARRLGRG